MAHPLARMARAVYHPWPMALLAGVLSALLLLAASQLFASLQAQRMESAEMNARGERFLQRIEQLFGQLREGLDELEGQPLRGCDRAMVEVLRQVSFSHRFIYEAAFIGGRQHCSSWPRQSSLDVNRPPDIKGTRHQYWLNTSAERDDDLAALVIGRGYFRVSTSRGHLADVVDLEPGSSLLLVGKDSGQVLPLLGPQPIWPPKGWPSPEDRPLLIGGEQLVYTMPRPGQTFQLVLVAPRAGLRQRIDDIWQPLLPACLLLALLTGALVFQQVRQRQSLTGSLAGALRRRELHVHYQPIIDLQSRRCVGAEALVRWQRPDGTLTHPDLFIPLAEATGQIRRVTDYVLEEVLEQLGDLLRSHPQLYISVNLAPCDVSHSRIAAVAARLLQRFKVAPQQIAFEITERGMVDVQAARETLSELRAQGHKVLIDDFGTGYCSLAYLQDLPIDYLKIDKTFVDTLGHDAASSGVAPHIIRMAHALELKVVAEGIEDDAQARLLASEGAHSGQGWLFDRALTAQKFRERMAAQAEVP
ncbi:EAL domain-containing protein [Pseudomonas zhanjiangensis]|uniref:cyclic-guanylate-specific phosphodiesterase n=1 Tax=Pseudomonas zhanjiangensis TaxID=3239015 RepID=A0ABV3YMG5_9PSED